MSVENAMRILVEITIELVGCLGWDGSLNIMLLAPQPRDVLTWVSVTHSPSFMFWVFVRHGCHLLSGVSSQGLHWF